MKEIIVHPSSSKGEGSSRRKTESVVIPNSLKEIYGGCDINTEWKTVGDLETNLGLLPEEVRMVVLGDSLKNAPEQMVEVMDLATGKKYL